MSRYDYSSADIEDLIDSSGKELFVLVGDDSGELTRQKIGEQFRYREDLGLFLLSEGTWKYEAPISFGRPRVEGKTDEHPSGALVVPYKLDEVQRATRLSIQNFPTVGFLGQAPNYFGLYLNTNMMQDSPNTGMVFMKPRD